MRPSLQIVGCVLLVVAVTVPSVAAAQPWAGILDQTRAINWSEGHQGIAGGPPMRTTICATLRPGATAAQISKAIASCGANQVVFLEAGTYLLSSGLSFGNKSRVTLRGAGPDTTASDRHFGDNARPAGVATFNEHAAAPRAQTLAHAQDAERSRGVRVGQYAITNAVVLDVQAHAVVPSLELHRHALGFRVS